MALVSKFLALGRGPVIASLFFVAALIFGGGGSPSPIAELVVQLSFVGAVFAWFWAPDLGPHCHRAPADPIVWAVMGLVLFVPLVQLVPLPMSVWSSLPGRESQLAALQIVDSANSWRPLSLAPARTTASLLAIIPALFALYATAALDQKGRMALLVIVAGMSIASALFGAVQLAAGTDGPRFYAATHREWLTGFQANRNAQADVLLIGSLALTAVVAAGMKARRAIPRKTALLTYAWATGGVLLLFCATVLTGSRAGVTLMSVALLGIVLVLRDVRPVRAARGLTYSVVAGGFVLLLASVVYALREYGQVSRVTARFAFSDEARPGLWADVWFAVMQYWPVGFGMGGFQQAILPAERLEQVRPSLPNRAHNDYLELLLEGGIFSLVILGLVVGSLVIMAFLSWRRRQASREQFTVGLTILLVFALHSIVDYPLRSMALACLCGLAVGLLAMPGKSGIQHRAAGGI